MSQIIETPDPPDAICHECQQNALYCEPVQTFSLYCVHRRCGAFSTCGGPWKVYRDMDSAAFHAAFLLAVQKFIPRGPRH